MQMRDESLNRMICRSCGRPSYKGGRGTYGPLSPKEIRGKDGVDMRFGKGFAESFGLLRV